jgi:[acyl-carrier-protein] S-malonyltransferase
LIKTQYLQPALTAVALGAASFLADEGVAPEIVVGHSAGEVAAASVAGHLNYESACGLSADRGRAMSKAARARPGGMVAVRGSADLLHGVVKDASLAGEVYVGGQTTEDTHLVTGESAALRTAASHQGVSRLPVSGPWHSPLMKTACQELDDRFESAIEDAEQGPTWVSNQTGMDARSHDRAVSVSELLLAQLTSPMKLHQSIEFMLAKGVTDVVVLGPGRALSHIVKRHLDERPTVRVHSTSSLQELQCVVRELS